MRTILGMAILVALNASVAMDARPDAVDLSRQIIARENARLAKSVQSTKGIMAMARMTEEMNAMCHHSIYGMESTIAAHTLILNGGQADLLVTTALGIVHGDLERHYAEQVRMRETPDGAAREPIEKTRRREQALLDELRTLREWQNKATDAAGTVEGANRVFTAGPSTAPPTTATPPIGGEAPSPTGATTPECGFSASSPGHRRFGLLTVSP